MIKIPEDVLSAAELMEATGRDAKNLDIEITGISLDRQSLVLSIDTRLNFVMPMKLESVMKERIRSKIGSAGKVRFNYMYTGIKVAPAGSEGGSDTGSGYGNNGNGSSGGNGGYRRRNAKEEPAYENAAGELILLGKDFSDTPVAFRDLEGYVGSKDKVCIEGEVFKIESQPIRSGKILVSILIASQVRTFCLKAFIRHIRARESHDGRRLQEGREDRQRRHLS